MTVNIELLCELTPLTAETLTDALRPQYPTLSPTELEITALQLFAVSDINDVPYFRTKKPVNTRQMLDNFCSYISTIREINFSEPNAKFYGKTALQQACLKGYDEWIKILIDLLKIAGPNKSLRTASLILNRVDKLSLPKSMLVTQMKGSFSTSNELTACFNQPDKTGRAALHYAVVSRHQQTVALLLSLDADINLKDGEGNTPLHIALQENNKDMADLLLKRGALHTINNNNNHPPLFIALASENDELMSLFIPLLNDTPGLHYACETMSPGAVAFLLKYQNNLHQENHRGEQPLHTACEHFCPAIISQLLSAGASCERPNRAGVLPFEQCISQGYARRATVPPYITAEVLRQFVDKGAQIEHLSRENRAYYDFFIQGIPVPPSVAPLRSSRQ